MWVKKNHKCSFEAKWSYHRLDNRVHVLDIMLLFLLICPVEGQGVAGEVNDILAEVKLLVNIPHRCGFGVHALEGLGVILVEVGHKD